MGGVELGEMGTFIKVWLSVFLSLCYSYALPKFVPKGLSRLLCLLPVVCLFLYLPLHLCSVNLVGTTSFFVSWLANFKLLLFAFGKGPLSSSSDDDHPSSSISLVRFVAVSCLPIKIQQNTVPEKTTNKKSPFNYAVKVLLLGLLLRLYDYSQYMHPKLIWAMYCFHML